MELLANAEQSTILLSAKYLKNTHYDKVYIRIWLSDNEREKDKLLRDRCYKLNQKFPSNTDGKKLYSVINGYIRERRLNGSINFNQEVDYDKLLNMTKPANVPNVSNVSDVSDIE